MFPLLWKEEHVFYLKMSSFDCTFLLAHRAGWSPSAVLSQYRVPFLHSCISSLQCTLISASICSLLCSSGGRYAACGQGPHSQYPALPLSQVLLNKAMGKRLPSDSMCVYVYVKVCVHTWSGRWGRRRWGMCQWSKRLYLFHSGPSMQSTSFFTPTLPVFKSKLQMLTNTLGKYSSNCPFCVKNTPRFTFCSLCYENNGFCQWFSSKNV